MRQLKIPHLTSPALFWDGAKQLSGELELRELELIFNFDDFKHTHLNLCIKLRDIDYAKVFLLFNISRNGLKVSSKADKIDLFILEDSKAFCEAIKNQIERLR